MPLLSCHRHHITGRSLRALDRPNLKTFLFQNWALLNMNFKETIDRKSSDLVGSGVSDTLQFITDSPAICICHGKGLGNTTLSNERI